jgi:hypothetical protein
MQIRCLCSLLLRPTPGGPRPRSVRRRRRRHLLLQLVARRFPRRCCAPAAATAPLFSPRPSVWNSCLPCIKQELLVHMSGNLLDHLLGLSSPALRPVLTADALASRFYRHDRYRRPIIAQPGIAAVIPEFSIPVRPLAAHGRVSEDWLPFALDSAAATLHAASARPDTQVWAPQPPAMLHWMPPCQSSLQAIISSSTAEGAGGSVPHSTLVLAGVVLLCTGSCTGGRPLGAASDRRILAVSATRDLLPGMEGCQRTLLPVKVRACSSGNRQTWLQAMEGDRQALLLAKLQTSGCKRIGCQPRSLRDGGPHVKLGPLLRAATSQNGKKMRGCSVGKGTKS